MKDTTLSGQLALSRSPLLFDLDTLFVQLQGVKDRRYRRGVRYPLAPTLLIGVLAKLAGAHSSREIAHWASLRAQELSRLLALKREQMPHFSTWSRILGTAVDPKEVEEVLGRFFKQRVKKPVKPGERHLCRDGKTLKGTIALGERQGVHWLAAYLPQEGVVLAPVQVPGAGSEVSAAPVLLATLDLRGMVVSGDALFASRKLSLSILHKKGDYLWMVKENRKQMYQEIQTLFEPQPSRPGWSAPSMDFRSASSRDKGHGRLEKRRIPVSSFLSSYSQWPGLSQVFKHERERTKALGVTKREVHYGLTSLPTSQASPKRVLERRSSNRKKADKL